MNQAKLIAAIGAVVCGTLGAMHPASAQFSDPSTARATASFTYSITLTDLAPDDGLDPFFEMEYSGMAAGFITFDRSTNFGRGDFMAGFIGRTPEESIFGATSTGASSETVLTGGSTNAEFTSAEAEAVADDWSIVEGSGFGSFLGLISLSPFTRMTLSAGFDLTSFEAVDCRCFAMSDGYVRIGTDESFSEVSSRIEGNDSLSQSVTRSFSNTSGMRAAYSISATTLALVETQPLPVIEPPVPTPVPEPTTYALMLVGLVAVTAASKSRKRSVRPRVLWAQALKPMSVCKRGRRRRE